MLWTWEVNGILSLIKNTKQLYLKNILRCHGEKDNVVFEMANKLNLLEGNTFTTDSLTIMKSNGKEFPTDIARKLFDLISGIINDSNDEMSKYSKSLGDFVQEKYLS